MQWGIGGQGQHKPGQEQSPRFPDNPKLCVVGTQHLQEALATALTCYVTLVKGRHHTVPHFSFLENGTTSRVSAWSLGTAALSLLGRPLAGPLRTIHLS